MKTSFFVVGSAILAAIGMYFTGDASVLEAVTSVLVALGWASHKYDSTPEA